MLLWTLFCLLSLVVAALIIRLIYLRRLMRRLEAELEALASARVLQGPDVEALLEPEHPTLITIEVLNPFELATQQSRLAGPASAVAPGLIRQEVMRQALQKVKAQLVAEGVQAEVKLVRAR